VTNIIADVVFFMSTNTNVKTFCNVVKKEADIRVSSTNQGERL